MLLLRRVISDLDTLFSSAAAQYCLEKQEKYRRLISMLPLILLTRRSRCRYPPNAQRGH